MSSLCAPSNVYIVNIRHKSSQYGINVRGNIQIKMFQRDPEQINVRFTNRSLNFGFFLRPDLCDDILINVDMTPTKIWIRSFTETKSPRFLHSLSNDRLVSVWGASVTLSSRHGATIVTCVLLEVNLINLIQMNLSIIKYFYRCFWRRQ